MVQSPAGRIGGLARGALLLGAAAVVSKLLGTLQKIPLQNIAGDHVFGIYNAVYPLYTLILFLATAGFPVAVSKLVAEERAQGRPGEALIILRASMLQASLWGAAGFAALYFGAETIAAWIGDRQTAGALQSVAFALLFVPALASLRGYFQGLGEMGPTAVSQVSEQFVRVAVMMALLLLAVNRGASDATIAAGATFGSVAGALAALLTMGVYWIRSRNREGIAAGVGERLFEKQSGSIPAGTRNVHRRLFALALPVSLGAIVVPMLTLTDTFTVPRLLQTSGLDETAAMAQFGVYNHGMPIVQLAAMIFSSVSVALVPALSAARVRGDMQTIRSSAETALKLTWLIGLAASAGIAVTAGPMSIMFYQSSVGAGVIAVLGFSAVFSVVQIVSASILQGWGAERAPAYYLLAAAGVKIVLNLILVPRYGITGAAVSAVAAFAAAAGLNLLQLRRLGLARLGRKDYLGRAPAAVLLMSAAAWLALVSVRFALDRAFPGMPERVQMTMVTLLAVAAGAAAFAVFSLRLGAIGAAEWAMFPGPSQKWLPVLRRWRMIPTGGDYSEWPHTSPSSGSDPGTKIN